ncbi:GntR family transcriptional regulator [Pseudooceanicola sediminis]|uniref:GntR family transcriptional regulator n=1 Tax=Pseudooceanicola sediminis TaxID=2211117 RepID=A0A399IZM9_9RHOB|nr:GntR family transcriptional regulator [Pseudooceanicola sediminis]KAA2313683.1 GntR family transcriptional regulator [Puniceibacterium sp. HSS470]RII38480.1 GntR family transcriptional regulator [Pseudooceanicola sediminis]|tara:strand:- start:90068 stop:90826 length:759 start_codon:yes stop_codon:yes gene_type:complete
MADRQIPTDPPAIKPAAVAGLTKVARESLQERVYQELRRSLFHGVFEAGQVMRMQSLADTLDVSLMPVREALARLVSEQALEVLPSRSVRVPLITQERLDDLAHARCLIEGELVRMAVPHLSQTDITGLRDLTERCEAAFATLGPDQAVQTSMLNHDFHYAIYGAARSAVLLPVAHSLWLQSGPYVRAAATIYGRSPGLTAVHHHWSLVEALDRRDAAAAVDALHQDITQSFNLIRADLLQAAEPKGVASHG